MSGKKICLFIGGAGFIGKNLAAEFSQSGYKVRIYDCVENNHSFEQYQNIEYFQGDYFSDGVSDMLISDCEFVVLLACSVGPSTSMEKPEICYGRDIIAMINLLEKMRHFNVNRLIFISSGGTVYGNHGEDSLCEDMQTFPINHYGIMKLTQEKILMMNNEIKGMNNLVFRLANPYGMGQKSTSGIGAVTAFMDRIIHGEEILIYGKGNQIRDYIYIKDVVKMIRLFIQNGTSAKNSENSIYNIGTGVGVSVNKVLEIIEEVVGVRANIRHIDSRAIDVGKNVLNNSKIKSVIGDYICFSLKDGIEEYYKEYRVIK